MKKNLIIIGMCIIYLLSSGANLKAQKKIVELLASAVWFLFELNQHLNSGNTVYTFENHCLF